MTMKQIFDWLREQIENKSNYEPVDYDYCDMACSGEQGFIAREDALDAINEAEAKWEKEYVSIGAYKQVAWERDIAIEQLHDLGYEFGEKIRETEVCEWKETYKHYTQGFHNCITDFDELWKQDVERFNFCPYCGKPIKISEVE